MKKSISLLVLFSVLFASLTSCVDYEEDLQPSQELAIEGPGDDLSDTADPDDDF